MHHLTVQYLEDEPSTTEIEVILLIGIDANALFSFSKAHETATTVWAWKLTVVVWSHSLLAVMMRAWCMIFFIVAPTLPHM